MFDSLKNKFRKFIGKVEEEVKEEEPKEEAREKEPEPELKKKEKKIKISAATKLKGILAKTVKLSEKDLEAILWDLQIDLIQSDVGVETSELIVERLRGRLRDREIEKDKVDDIIREVIREILLRALEVEKINLLEHVKNAGKPVKIIFLGVNGTGKTTTIAKAAKYLMNNGFSVVLAAGDTFRAGAIEQLTKHAENLGVGIIKSKKGADSAAVIYDAVEHADAKGIDVVLADTAGRMQTNVNLMDEMKKICRVNKPDLRIFVGDALTGNDAIEQAKQFNDAVGIDGMILTKMDADARGGCGLSIVNEIKKPILFVGVGQSYEDLKEFDVGWFVDKIV
ncbi:MAG: signal recognition particle-docking protein FtsY [Candidatus Altiarchaeales archaeon WOR_SM1_86-2]|nr:MAG: signal recognition particle-docking protein FtsY [Candidatus Altiarchaeales archaeon WOR_SM1_86-2]